ncbi:hypothetical protein GLA29479_3065 [Lysobacter antibioticus]|uniref:hypothetical protein n=1 Tax=Lysobacter antibioticus TaxID=84531 RepID=UPI0007170DFD|nr:hypothetical protein [Lysobacter antibioticus]ALN63927.1 hypothetical protein GLA29479_3065 [Lysobacter antibioticus]
MSRIVYTGAPINPRWSTNQPIFVATQYRTGPVAVRQAANFGAASATAVLGLDLIMPGQQGNNVPTAIGAPWNQLLPDGPQLMFTQDNLNTWIRAHLINGRWGGAGNGWQNLVPMTAPAYANQATVEAYMDAFLAASYQYETSGQRDAWYGLYYCVQSSVSPFSDAATTNKQNLYAYAPEFIRILWRAVRILKPVNVSTATAAANLGTYPMSAVAAFPVSFVMPPLPKAMNGTATLPQGKVAGGAVLGALPGNVPAAQANGFDSEIEIHQI